MFPWRPWIEYGHNLAKELSSSLKKEVSYHIRVSRLSPGTDFSTIDEIAVLEATSSRVLLVDEQAKSLLTFRF